MQDTKMPQVHHDARMAILRNVVAHREPLESAERLLEGDELRFDFVRFGRNRREDK